MYACRSSIIRFLKKSVHTIKNGSECENAKFSQKFQFWILISDLNTEIYEWIQKHRQNFLSNLIKLNLTLHSRRFIYEKRETGFTSELCHSEILDSFDILFVPNSSMLILLS